MNNATASVATGQATSPSLSISVSLSCDETLPSESPSSSELETDKNFGKCTVRDLFAAPTEHFRRVTHKTKSRFVPEFRVWCKHTEYALTHALRCCDTALGNTDVCLYTRTNDACGCMERVVVKTMEHQDGCSEAANVRALELVNETHRFFVDAAVAYEPTDKATAESRGVGSYIAIVMPACAASLRDVMPTTYEGKMYAFRQITKLVHTLWTVADMAYLDMKSVNVLVSRFDAPSFEVLLCDHGAFCERGGAGGNATYPPPTEPTGVDVPATEANVCWGLGVLLYTMFSPVAELDFRYVSRATKARVRERRQASMKIRGSMQTALGHFQTYMPLEARRTLEACWSSFSSPSTSTLQAVLEASSP